MSPEYGATMGFFPVDDETLRYLERTGRPQSVVERVEKYCKEQNLFHSADSPEPEYSGIVELDLGSVESSVAGPRRPQDRVALSQLDKSFRQVLPNLIPTGARREVGEQDGARWAGEGGHSPVAVAAPAQVETEIEYEGNRFSLTDGSVVIAAITSCTNTSNPSVMIGAGMLAERALERGLSRKPWVKTSMAPGSKVVTEYLKRSGHLKSLEALGFNVVGYGCTTCIGNSGPLAEPISRAIVDHSLVTAAVLSGNRNFEARIHPHVRASYLASPMLVVAFALTGRVDIDIVNEPLGVGSDGKPVYLKEIWPTQEEINDAIAESLDPEIFEQEYATVFEGTAAWKKLPVPKGRRFAWSSSSTYVANPPFFNGLKPKPGRLKDIKKARVLAWLGDTTTTDHISPAGAIPKDSPAGQWLQDHGVRPVDFNTFGSRRGHHDVMMRGTFGNIRIKNRLVDGQEGNWTIHFPTAEGTSIFDAAMRYQEAGTPLIILAGTEYGTGSSRDWAAKGTNLLGVQAVIASSYERIHRSNLIGMGVLPLQFQSGETADSLGLSGLEEISITGIADGLEPGCNVHVTARDDGKTVSFDAIVRLDTGVEIEYYRHGGILQFVLRKLS